MIYSLKQIKLPAMSKDGVLLIDAEKIYFVSGEGYYTKIHTTEKEWLCKLTLNEIEERLKDRLFFRAHRSFIVNLNRCHSICLGQKGNFLQMTDKFNTKIPVSRKKMKILRDVIGF